MRQFGLTGVAGIDLAMELELIGKRRCIDRSVAPAMLRKFAKIGREHRDPCLFNLVLRTEFDLLPEVDEAHVEDRHGRRFNPCRAAWRREGERQQHSLRPSKGATE
jgi:hypothetical protein